MRCEWLGTGDPHSSVQSVLISLKRPGMNRNCNLGIASSAMRALRKSAYFPCAPRDLGLLCATQLPDPAAAVVVPAPQRAPFFRARDGGPQFLAPIHRAMGL